MSPRHSLTTHSVSMPVKEEGWNYTPSTGLLLVPIPISATASAAKRCRDHLWKFPRKHPLCIGLFCIPNLGSPAHTEEIHPCTCSSSGVQDAWLHTHTLQAVCSSFSGLLGLLPLSFPSGMLAGVDPAVHSTRCHSSHEELTRRSLRICWWYVYALATLSYQQCSWDLWEAELLGTEQGTRGFAVICTQSPSHPSPEIPAFGLLTLCFYYSECSLLIVLCTSTDCIRGAVDFCIDDTV